MAWRAQGSGSESSRPGDVVLAELVREQTSGALSACSWLRCRLAAWPGSAKRVSQFLDCLGHCGGLASGLAVVVGSDDVAGGGLERRGRAGCCVGREDEGADAGAVLDEAEGDEGAVDAAGGGAADAGEFPCRIIRIGDLYRVATADLIRLLGSADNDHEGLPQAP